jgi:hypothetical protein
MADDMIHIDQPTLNRLKTQYVDLLTDLDTRLASYQWDSGDPASTVRLGDPFKLRLGGAEFTEAVGLASALDVVRKNLTGRFDTVYTNASNLRWGLQYLLEDSDAVEHLNTMTSADFESFIPTENTTPDPGAGGGGGRGGGQGSGS